MAAFPPRFANVSSQDLTPSAPPQPTHLSKLSNPQTPNCHTTYSPNLHFQPQKHIRTHTHITATLPMPWFTSLNTHKLCFHFSPHLLVLVFPSSSHHKLAAPSHTLVKKHPPSQQCMVTRDETFSPQETSCSETLWLKCVFSWDMKRRAGGGF